MSLWAAVGLSSLLRSVTLESLPRIVLLSPFLSDVVDVSLHFLQQVTHQLIYRLIRTTKFSSVFIPINISAIIAVLGVTTTKRLFARRLPK